MLFPALHAFRRNAPNLLSEIQFGPSRADRFAGPGGRQDQKFERGGSNSIFRAQIGYESRQFAVRQGRVVLDFGDLRAPGQKLLEMAAPARWILPRAIAAGLGPIKDRLDAPAHTVSRLGL